MRRPDGEVRYDRLRSWPRRLPDGRTVWDGATDITEHKRSQEALQVAHERLRTLVSSIQTSLLLVGEDDRIALANEAFCDYFEVSEPPL